LKPTAFRFASRITADEWVPAFEGLIDRNSVVIRNLTTGDKLQFRVRAYNMAGPSPPAMLGQAVSIQEIIRGYSCNYFLYYYFLKLFCQVWIFFLYLDQGLK